MFREMMKEVSEIFQPMYDDINNWKNLSDIGKFSDNTMREMREAWGAVPKPIKKDLYKAYKLILKHSPTIALQIVKLFFASQGIKLPS